MEKEFYDILDLLHVDTKEDVYTFCLAAFLDHSKEFRMQSASTWGFNETDDYKVLREAIVISGAESKHRKKIIPDLILYSEAHIAVIESKMFSSEGYEQSLDYSNAKAKIIEKIQKELDNKYHGGENGIQFYYFTLAGVPAQSKDFAIVSWADYYSKTLSGFVMENPELAILQKAILVRAEELVKLKSNIKDLSYEAIYKGEGCTNSWIGPYSLFSSGRLNDEWKLDPSVYYIYNGRVDGQGHSTFRTDISKRGKYWIRGNSEEDNIYLFTRIEWGKTIDVVINWEYWRYKEDWNGYIPFSKLSPKMQEISENNKHELCCYLERNKEEGMRVPTEKNNMLHMLIYSIDPSGKTLGDIVKDIRTIVKKYEIIEDKIAESIKNIDGSLRLEF